MLRAFSRALVAFLAATALIVALPVAAGAQSAGDDQYADPFGELPEEGSAEGDGGGGSGGGPTPGDGSSAGDLPATPAAQEAPEASTTDPDSSAAGSGEQLARTGLPAGVLALLGFCLLIAGAMLRAALRPARR